MKMFRQMARGRLAWLCFATLFPPLAAAQTNDEAEVDALIQAIGPLISQFALGGVLGFCAGYAIKKVGKVVAIVIGLAFILLQVLAYYKVIVIDWTPIARWWDMMRQQDTMGNAWTALRTVLFGNVPAVVGAVPGFLLGLKRG